MSRKKPTEQKPAAEKPFRTSPFAALKGVVVESQQPVSKPAEKVVIPKQEPAEEDLFMKAMSGVQRLTIPDEHKKKASPATAKSRKAETHKTVIPKPLARDEVTARRTFLQEVEKLQLDVRFEDNLPDDELRQLTGNRLRQLKRGVIQLDRQLDLHGLTREEALESLSVFISSARRAGEKAVLVITGKGIHSSNGPILQQVVAGWLRDQGRELISEYALAPQGLGDGGAFVIFLQPLDKLSKE